MPALKTSFGKFAGGVLKNFQGGVVTVDEEIAKAEGLFEMTDGFNKSESFLFRN